MEKGIRRIRERFQRLGRRWLGGLVAGIGLGMIIGAGMTLSAQKQALYYLFDEGLWAWLILWVTVVLFLMGELITGQLDIRLLKAKLLLGFIVLLFLGTGGYSYCLYSSRLSKPGIPLTMAVYDGDMAKVARLLQIDPQALNTSPLGATALHYAALEGNFPLVIYLIANGADLSARAQDGATAEEVARRNHHDEVADYLMKLREDGVARQLTEQNQ